MSIASIRAAKKAARENVAPLAPPMMDPAYTIEPTKPTDESLPIIPMKRIEPINSPVLSNILPGKLTDLKPRILVPSIIDPEKKKAALAVATALLPKAPIKVVGVPKAVVDAHLKTIIPRAGLSQTAVKDLTDPRLKKQSKIVEYQNIIASKRTSFVEKTQARKKLRTALEEYEALRSPVAPDAPSVIREAEPLPEVKDSETFSLSITLNAKQLQGVELAEAGKTFVLTGAAGTGKTTGVREIGRGLLNDNKLRTHDFKAQDSYGNSYRAEAPSIAFCAYTRRATNNMRRALHMDPALEKEFKHNVVTVHRLLEYEPVKFITEEGNESMRFEPQRTRDNPLTLTNLIIEESSMLDINLYEKLRSALPEDCQIIFLGDINQLPPIMGKSVLSYALTKLPVIELTDVYRQALDSDIIVAAHAVLKGDTEKFLDVATNSPKKQVRIVGRTSSYTEERLVQGLAQSFEKLHTTGIYDPDEDIILSPFNKNALGTENINKWIAQFLGKKRNAVVHEILAGRRKLYLAVGDKVMVEKKDGIIEEINLNAKYIGAMFQPASVDLTRFGIRIYGSAKEQNAKADDDDLFVGYENLNIDDEPTDEKKREASHVVKVVYDDGSFQHISAVGMFDSATFTLGYALTVHKAQGCEWRKVYLVLHRNHAVLLNRELFYTACTRAKEKLEIIAHESVIHKAISNARIKGSSLEEKVEYFNSGALDGNAITILPSAIEVSTEDETGEYYGSPN